MPTTRKKAVAEEKFDLPPTGSANRDPISDETGSHPIETGVGTALGGAAAGLVAGAAAGPVGAVIGAVAGGIAGGLAGHEVGEQIDPTVSDAYLRESFAEKPYVRKGATYETYEPAYRYGGTVEAKYRGRAFEEIEPELQADWDKTHAKTTKLKWEDARPAIAEGYDRTLQLREEQLKVNKTREKTGDVGVRKEIVTETKTINVPVEREEIVIERRKVNRHSDHDVEAEEIRIPVSEERVHVGKETVVTEEVTVGKRKSVENQTVSGTVKKEKLQVEETGDAKVSKTTKKR